MPLMLSNLMHVDNQHSFTGSDLKSVKGNVVKQLGKCFDVRTQGHISRIVSVDPAARSEHADSMKKAW